MEIIKVEHNQTFSDRAEDVKNNQVSLVKEKVLFLLRVKGVVDGGVVKDFIRYTMGDLGIGIRHRVDLGENRHFIHGVVTAVVRVDGWADYRGDEKMQEIVGQWFDVGEREKIRFERYEVNDVFQVRNVNDVFNRALYGVNIDLKKEQNYERKEDRIQVVQEEERWDGKLKEVDYTGKVRVKVKKLESKSFVYQVVLDVPYGVDVARAAEMVFGIRKGKLKDYPFRSLKVYKEIKSKKGNFGDKYCGCGKPIERTVGGLVDGKCVSCMMGL